MQEVFEARHGGPPAGGGRPGGGGVPRRPVKLALGWPKRPGLPTGQII